MVWQHLILDGMRRGNAVQRALRLTIRVPWHQIADIDEYGTWDRLRRLELGRVKRVDLEAANVVLEEKCAEAEVCMCCNSAVA